MCITSRKNVCFPEIRHNIRLFFPQAITHIFTYISPYRILLSVLVIVAAKNA